MNPDPGTVSAVEASIVDKSFALGSRLGKNALWLLLGRVANHLIFIAISILIARSLGDAVLGQYALVTSVLFLFNGISTLGTDTLLVREIAAKQNFSIFLPALTIQIGISLLIFALVLILGPLFETQSADGILALQIYTLSLLPLAFFTVFGAALRGKEEMGAYSLIATLNALLQLIAVAFLVPRDMGIVRLVTVLFGMNLLSAIIACAVALSKLPQLRTFWLGKKDSIGAVLRAGAAIALFGILATAYQRTSLYFVGGMQGAATTGWFAAAARVVEAPKFLHVAVLSTLLPSMSFTFSTPRKNNKTMKTYTMSLIGLIIFSAASSVLISVFTEPLMRILFGEQFNQGIPPLRILAWTLVPFAISQFFAVRLLAKKREKQVILALAIGIAALSLLCSLSIPVFGIVGAAWSVLMAEILLAILLIGFSYLSK